MLYLPQVVVMMLNAHDVDGIILLPEAAVRVCSWAAIPPSKPWCGLPPCGRYIPATMTGDKEENKGNFGTPSQAYSNSVPDQKILKHSRAF